jgi:hypothetical protein
MTTRGYSGENNRMAFEFYYCVSLDILHPSADPKRISQQITGFRVTSETMAGSERVTKDGTVIVPRRLAALTHWAASLHPNERIYSGDLDLADFLRARLSDCPIRG